MVLGALGACLAPEPVELRLDDARDALARRADPATLEEVLALVELPPTALAIPPAAERQHPGQPGFWMVRALAWSPAVRAARGEWRALRAEATSAGAPAPIAIQVVDHELGGDDELVEAIGVLDLIGLLGLGPSRAERRLAHADAALALGRLELAVWDGWLAVERARLRHVAAGAREQILGELAEAARGDLERVAILERTGRLSLAESASARAAVATIERRRSAWEESTLAARATLALAAGVSGDEPELALAQGLAREHVAAVTLPAELTGDAPLEPLDRYDRHPRLRAAWLRFALAEAAIRRAAASAWPGLALGPHVGYLDEAQIGAVLRLAVPFPSSWRGRLAAAVERRDAAIDAFEDQLAALTIAEREARARHRTIARRASGATPTALAAAHAEWRAARTAFRAGRGGLLQWMVALEQLAARSTWSIDEAEALALATMAIIEARGPAASPFAPPAVSQ
ncbi:MAG: hypothetical protein WD226_12090 [Planctomycetota bacterium]